MPLVAPDPFPLTWRDRAKAASYGVLMIGLTAFLFWFAERIAAPDWKPALPRMDYLLAFPPFWRGAHIAIIGSWTGAMGLLLLWKATRPYTPDPARQGSGRR